MDNPLLTKGNIPWHLYILSTRVKSTLKVLLTDGSTSRTGLGIWVAQNGYHKLSVETSSVYCWLNDYIQWPLLRDIHLKGQVFICYTSEAAFQSYSYSVSVMDPFLLRPNPPLRSHDIVAVGTTRPSVHLSVGYGFLMTFYTLRETFSFDHRPVLKDSNAPWVTAFRVTQSYWHIDCP